MSLTYSKFTFPTYIHSGAQSRAMIPELFRGLGGKRIVLFSDRGLEAAGVVDKVASIFSQTIHSATEPQLVGIYLDVMQDADSNSVNSAIEYAREKNADSVLAVGGGSVIDTVKAVKYALHVGATDITDIIQGPVVGFDWPEAQPIPIPHITVPTTHGTGSEVTSIAVVYNEKRKQKTNLVHPFIASDIAVLDPDLTVGLPPMITAFTSFDCLTHGIEALASPVATVFSDSFALQSIRVTKKNIVEVVKNGTNLNARMEMLQASTMSVAAFVSATGAIPVHNLSHAYGALYRIPHGLANAVLLPVVMELMPELYLGKIDLLGEALGLDIRDQSAESIHSNVLQTIRDLQKEVGLPSDFSEYDIPKDSLEQLIKAVHSDAAGMVFPLQPEFITEVARRVSK